MAHTKDSTNFLKNKDLDDSARIKSIIEEQRELIDNFIKTGGMHLVAKFKLLAAEFQHIHQQHQLGISTNFLL